MPDRYPFLISDSELVLLNNAINSHLLTLDSTGPTFDLDVDEFLTLKDRIDSECDWRDEEQRRATGQNGRVPGWFCGNVGCPVVGQHEHAAGVQAGRGGS